MCTRGLPRERIEWWIWDILNYIQGSMSNRIQTFLCALFKPSLFALATCGFQYPAFISWNAEKLAHGNFFVCLHVKDPAEAFRSICFPKCSCRPHPGGFMNSNLLSFNFSVPVRNYQTVVTHALFHIHSRRCTKSFLSTEKKKNFKFQECFSH